MYAAFGDPYCYPGTNVLVNSMNLRDPAELEAFEEEMVRTRADEPLPPGRLTARHFRAVHRHLFQESMVGREKSERFESRRAEIRSATRNTLRHS
jgi:cell filamentation protein